MNRPTLSIRNHWIITSITVVMLVISLLALSAYSQITREREVAEAETRRLAAIVATDVGQYMDDLKRVLDELALRGTQKVSGPESCASWSDAIAFLPPSSNAGILTPDGAAICTDSGLLSTLSFADNDWFTGAVSSDEVYLSAPLVGRVSGNWIVVLSRSIRGDDGDVLGVARLTIDLVSLEHSLHSALLPATSVVTINDDDGTILARSIDPDEWVGVRFPESGASTDAGGGVNVAVSLEGVEMLFGYAPVPSLNWWVFVGVPAEQLVGPVQASMRRSGLLAFGASALVLMLMVTGYRRMVIPLGVLVSSTRAAVLGEIDHITLHGPAELVDVAQRFDDALRQKRAIESTVATLSQVAAQSPDPILITDLEGIIEYVNPAFEDVTGYTQEEVLGETPGLLKSGVHRAEFYEDLWRTILSGRPFRGTITNRNKSGELYFEDKTITPLISIEDGAITHFVSTGRDITERVTLQDRLKRSEKLEAVGRLAAGVAHDFNNLLTVIRGHAELLSKSPTLQSETDERASVLTIVDSTEMAANLTRELLTFSRKDARAPQAILLDDVVRKVKEILDRLLPADIKVDLSLSGRGIAIELDPVHAEQIVLNLALNARDAMLDRGGTLSIRTDTSDPPRSILGIAPNAAHGFVHLEVSDTGMGMTSDTEAHIFEPYFSTKGLGSGLGLATVYGVVEDAGGLIDVQSTPGQGSAFHVYLPATTATPTTSPDEAGRSTHEHAVDDGLGDEAPVAARAKEMIAVAEDNDEVRDLVTRILHTAGYEVLAADDGRSALTMIESHEREIGLLVTDVMMPRMKGPELCDRVRADRPALPVLFISGYDEGFSAEDTLGTEHTAFLQKPFRAGALLQKIEELIDEADTE